MDDPEQFTSTNTKGRENPSTAAQYLQIEIAHLQAAIAKNTEARARGGLIKLGNTDTQKLTTLQRLISELQQGKPEGVRAYLATEATIAQTAYNTYREEQDETKHPVGVYLDDPTYSTAKENLGKAAKEEATLEKSTGELNAQSLPVAHKLLKGYMSNQRDLLSTTRRGQAQIMTNFYGQDLARINSALSGLSASPPIHAPPGVAK